MDHLPGRRRQNMFEGGKVVEYSTGRDKGESGCQIMEKEKREKKRIS